MNKIKTVIAADDVPFHHGDIIDYVYGSNRDKIAELTDLHPVRITTKNLKRELPRLAEIEAIFSTWGLPPFTPEQLARLPNLKVLFYAAGAVHGFVGKFQARGITVCSAVDANAIPVAEYILAHILLGCKNFHRNSLLCRRGPWQQSDMPAGPGCYGETVALIGVGAITRHLLKLLKPFKLRIIAVSRHLAGQPEEAKALGIDKIVDLKEAFRSAYVVSNHLPDTEALRGTLRYEHFVSMRYGATFLNTGRGAQVNEKELCAALVERPDLNAVLDVQYPEPPKSGSPLYTLPNVQLSSHIAGSCNNEVRRMSDYMLDDLQRYLAGEPLLHTVPPANGIWCRESTGLEG